MEIVSTSLKKYSSLNIGGEGSVVSVKNEEELVEAISYAEQKNLRIHFLGEGTNTFFADTLETILFIKNEIKGITLERQRTHCLLTACSGENWDDVVQYGVSQNLWGIENLSYIPGTVGAAPVQNIGAYGVELKDTLVTLRAYDRETRQFVIFKNEDCKFGYRDSIFKEYPGRYCIVSITCRLSEVPHPVLTYKPLDILATKKDLTLGEVRELVVATRKAKLPDYRQYPNTGSFFKNPIVTKIKGDTLRSTHSEIPLIPFGDDYKIPAAWLIEHVAEMKGVRIKDVGTWPNQPLVVVNYGQATAKELLDFSQRIIHIIKEKTGIELMREVNYIS